MAIHKSPEVLQFLDSSNRNAESFDLHDYTKLGELVVRSAKGVSPLKCLDVDMTLEARDGRTVSMKLRGVLQFCLPELRAPTYLDEIEIHDIRDAQIEGGRYEIMSHLDSFSVVCWDVRLVVGGEVADRPAIP